MGQLCQWAMRATLPWPRTGPQGAGHVALDLVSAHGAIDLFKFFGIILNIQTVLGVLQNS
jgi:hypothetical protein